MYFYSKLHSCDGVILYNKESDMQYQQYQHLLSLVLASNNW